MLAVLELTRSLCLLLQSRAETADSALKQLCGGINENNGTVVGDAVEECPPEQADDLSTALAQGAANETTAPCIAEVSGGWQGQGVVSV